MTDATEIKLTLTISDMELCAELAQYAEEQERCEFAIRAMKIGALALRQAQGRIDVEQVRREGNQLIANLAQRLEGYQREVTGQIGNTLKGYFDQESGQFDQRVKRLISSDGELEQLLRSKIGNNGSELAQTLAAHVGENSPLMLTLNPDANSGIISSLTKATEKTLSDQREQILKEFSLDNGDGALSRLVNEVKKETGDMMVQFSLDKEDSALSRLMSRVEGAQRQISGQFSLDDEGSALARMRKDLLGVLTEQGKLNNEFQSDVRERLTEMTTRRDESRRSTRHGVEFEEAVFQYANERSQNAGDIATRTGNTTGIIRNNRKGDVVIKLGPDQEAAGVKIVIEAKENASYTLQGALDELEEGRKNREAAVGLFVFSARTAPEGLQPLGRYGDDVVIVWDAEDGGSDVVFNAGLAVAKALCSRSQARNAAQFADFGSIERALREIERQANALQEITTSAETIKNGSDKILQRARIVREGLEKQVAILDEKVDELRAVVGDGGDMAAAA